MTWVVVPALGHNLINIEQINVMDRRHALANETHCGDVSTSIFYRVSVTSIALRDSNVCDVAKHPGADRGNCTTTTDILYTTYLTTSYSSTRQKRRKDIVLDESAIAGGVTFFTYFLSVFVL